MRWLLTLFGLLPSVWGQQPLPFTTNVAQGVTMTETVIAGAGLTLQWGGPGGDQYAFAVDNKQNYYRSTDFGKTWTNENYKLNQTNPTAQTLEIQISVADPNYVILYGSKTPYPYWTSTDGGNSWVKHDLFSSLGRLYLALSNPANPNYLIGIWDSAGCWGRSGNKPCIYSTYVSTNFGTSWLLLSQYSEIAYWEPSNDAILFTVHPTPANPSSCTANGGGCADCFDYNQSCVLKRYSLASSTSVSLLDLVLTLYQPNPIGYYAAVDIEASPALLLRSNSPDPTNFNYSLWIESSSGYFNPLQFEPAYRSYEGTGFYIAEVSTYDLWISLQNPSNRYSGDLFRAPYNFATTSYPEFSFVKGSQRRQPFDFSRFDGLKGVFVANFYKDGQTASRTTPVVSQVSWNNGKSWARMAAPYFASDGTRPCPQDGSDCWLHVQIGTWPGIYAAPGSPGIVMSWGSYGPGATSPTATLVSNDGGVTWTEVIKGLYIYEIGDNGDLLVAANLAGTVTSTIFSLDEGQTWTELPLGTAAQTVENIRIEPTWSSEVFVMHGSRSGQGVITHLDFTAVYPRTCVGYSNPDTATSDYTLWLVQDPQGNSCIEGVQTSYVRRKQTAACFNPEQESIQSSKPCTCTVADYVCSPCYQWDSSIGTGQCIAICDAADMFNMYGLDPCQAGQSSYYEPAGYQKIPGDLCTGGPALEVNNTRACPNVAASESGSGGHGGVVALVVILFLLAIIAGVLTFTVTKYNQPAFLVRFVARFRGQQGGGIYGRMESTQFDDTLLQDKVDDEPKDPIIS